MTSSTHILDRGDQWLDENPELAATMQLIGGRCGWTVGPIPKLDGEVCVCTESSGHRLPHRCSCGSWFEGCGHAPTTAV